VSDDPDLDVRIALDAGEVLDGHLRRLLDRLAGDAGDLAELPEVERARHVNAPATRQHEPRLGSPDGDFEIVHRGEDGVLGRRLDIGLRLRGGGRGH